ncbi:hypothetical protein [Synoicihabitans lomoniglobus]|uniref:Glycosyltransferase RgtA/B/C/D-like domain-containing protein n=1 Tax=Synoicihabitans lomoniglobus TaxID=2909285 RepID=A0AAF0CPR0_9BACT|nr:hypothetical protein [Opitutaceae bacterium LMO-M01]WED65779.1 hypothetical protein PXH66_02825 [Opitutaceae bacterium LMO-M01]
MRLPLLVSRLLQNYPLLGLVVCAVAAMGFNFPRLTGGQFNWIESHHIAAALLEGRGFSDPFNGQTGPTAWVPPVFVWIAAAIFAVAGIKTPLAAAVLLGLTVIGHAAVHAVLVACIDPAARRMRRLVSCLYLSAVVLMPNGPFQLASENWLQVLLPVTLVWAALAHRRNPDRKAGLTLAALAIVGPLAHAGFAVALALTLLGMFFFDLRERRSWAIALRPVMAALLTVLTIGAWTVRNTMALDRVIPLKSNFWFEMHLANVASANGLPRTEEVLREMPFFNTAQFNRYATLGEVAYVDSFREPTIAALEADPGAFRRKVMRRAMNAFVYLDSSSGSEITALTFTAMDQRRIAATGMLQPVDGSRFSYWHRIDLPPTEAWATLNALHLDDFEGVWSDWSARHLKHMEAHYSALALALGFAFAGLPTLAWFGLLLAGRGKLPPIAGWATLGIVGLLLPYVLINHSARHQGPLLGLQVIIVAACINAWCDRWGAASH